MLACLTGCSALSSPRAELLNRLAAATDTKSQDRQPARDCDRCATIRRGRSTQDTTPPSEDVCGALPALRLGGRWRMPIVRSATSGGWCRIVATVRAFGAVQRQSGRAGSLTTKMRMDERSSPILELCAGQGANRQATFKERALGGAQNVIRARRSSRSPPLWRSTSEACVHQQSLCDPCVHNSAMCLRNSIDAPECGRLCSGHEVHSSHAPKSPSREHTKYARARARWRFLQCAIYGVHPTP